MKPESVVELVIDNLVPKWTAERARLDVIDKWLTGDGEDIRLPSMRDREKKALLEVSRTPWLGLVVTSTAQMLYVNGYRSPESSNDSHPWKTWRANEMDSRQVPLHRAALGYGYSYLTVLPGDAGGQARAVMRGVSPRDMLAVYADPADDEWPMFALKVRRESPTVTHYSLFDEESEHLLAVEDGRVSYIEARIHGVGVCPVVRYANDLDLEGRTRGEVAPNIPVAARINKTSHDRMLAQHFNSWKVRTATGLDSSMTEEEKAETKLRVQHDTVLTGEEGVTFGTLPETPLDGIIRAWESDVEALAAVTQTPTHNLTGKMINLSAEALAAAESMLGRKVHERQMLFGAKHEQALRLTAHIEGRREDAEDFLAHATWADLESRSLAQAVDAWGKAVQMLNVPARGVWGRIPGVTKDDVTEWEKIAAEGDPFAALVDEIAAGGGDALAFEG